MKTEKVLVDNPTIPTPQQDKIRQLLKELEAELQLFLNSRNIYDAKILGTAKKGLTVLFAGEGLFIN
jgi:hypothetical protein